MYAYCTTCPTNYTSESVVAVEGWATAHEQSMANHYVKVEGYDCPDVGEIMASTVLHPRPHLKDVDFDA